MNSLGFLCIIRMFTAQRETPCCVTTGERWRLVVYWTGINADTYVLVPSGPRPVSSRTDRAFYRNRFGSEESLKQTRDAKGDGEARMFTSGLVTKGPERPRPRHLLPRARERNRFIHEKQLISGRSAAAEPRWAPGKPRWEPRWAPGEPCCSFTVKLWGRETTTHTFPVLRS